MPLPDFAVFQQACPERYLWRYLYGYGSAAAAVHPWLAVFQVIFAGTFSATGISTNADASGICLRQASLTLRSR